LFWSFAEEAQDCSFEELTGLGSLPSFPLWELGLLKFPFSPGTSFALWFSLLPAYDNEDVPLLFLFLLYLGLFPPFFSTSPPKEDRYHNSPICSLADLFCLPIDEIFQSEWLSPGRLPPTGILFSYLGTSCPNGFASC